MRTSILVVLTLGIELILLPSATAMLTVTAGAALITAALTVARGDLARLGIGAACLCSFTITWNGWFIGPFRPGDLLILVTLILLFAAKPNAAFGSPPWWIKQLALIIVLGVVIQVLFPPDQGYLNARTVLDAGGQPTVSTNGSLAAANIGIAFKFIVAVLMIPVAFIAAARSDRRAASWLTTSFAAGAALSGWVAFGDHFGANVGRLLTGVSDGGGGRSLGFADQPNFLAAGLVIAAPFAYWLILSGRGRSGALGIWALIGLIVGTYASGSRGGAVTLIIVLAICIAVHPRSRTYSFNIFLAALVAVGFVVTAVPTFGYRILKVTRLVGQSSAQGSDLVRSLVGAQGTRDFQHSPIFGIGLQVATEASQVYKQELATGGIVLFIAMQLYMFGGIVTGLAWMARVPMAGAAAASLVAMLFLNLVEADLTDRFYYTPAALLVSTLVAYRRANESGDRDLPPADHVITATVGQPSAARLAALRLQD